MQPLEINLLFMLQFFMPNSNLMLHLHFLRVFLSLEVLCNTLHLSPILRSILLWWWIVKSVLPFLQVIHYELPNDPETFVHRSGRTGRAGKEGNAILMFTSSQRRTVRSLERDVGCKFEFVSAPAVEEVLESSAEHVVATLSGVHPESVEFFTPTAQKLIEEKGIGALAAALAQLSGFSRPPSARSLINHEQVNDEISIFRLKLTSCNGLSSIIIS